MPPNNEYGEGDITGLTALEKDKGITRAKQQQQKSSDRLFTLNIGSYRASILPLTIITLHVIAANYVCQGFLPHPFADGRFLLGNMPVMFLFVATYILFCTVWGPRMMKNRDTIKLKGIIKSYNIFQVAVCCYMFYEFAASGWLGNYNILCEPVTYTDVSNEGRMVSVVYLYFLTKLLDLLDTVFFVFNKKWDHISLLHLVHHSTMVLSTAYGALYAPRGHVTFTMLFNSFVHICMYGYYYLATLGPAVRPYLWWKKYMTALQIIQLITSVMHSSLIFLNDSCAVDRKLISIPMASVVTYLILFLEFYYYSYIKENSKLKGKEVAENGVHRSEVMPEYILPSLNLKHRK